MRQRIDAAIVRITTRGIEEGQSLVEYAIVCALIAIAALVAVEALGTGVAGAFESMSGKLPKG